MDLVSKMFTETEIRQNFNASLRSLIKECTLVVRTKHSASLQVGNSRSEIDNMKKFMTRYVKPEVDTEDYYCSFERLFGKFREDILQSNLSDVWLRRGRDGKKITIQGLEQGEQIDLSAIFVMAHNIKDESNPITDETDSSDDAFFPTRILLQLMRIFYYLNSGSDVSRLGLLVNHFEEILKFDKTPTPASTSTNKNPALTGMANMAKTVASVFGVKLPDFEIPDTDQLKESAAKLMTSDAAKEVISSATNNANGAVDYVDMISNMKKAAVESGFVKAETIDSFIDQMGDGIAGLTNKPGELINDASVLELEDGGYDE